MHGRIAEQVNVVSDDIGHGQVEDRGAVGESGKPATLDRGDVLADRIDLGDRSPRFQQQGMEPLLGGKGDPIRRQAGQCG